jgi:molybdenum-dependent DNA-binding transcriptional regulator ModE
MIGITLSSEQIRRAPTEVRRWIEKEIPTSLGSQVQATGSESQAGQLVECSYDELARVLSLIQGVFPVLNVFFELGRKGIGFAEGRLEAYRLSDIQHHARLQSPERVISCLNVINESLQRVRGSTAGSFFGTDGDYCFIATATQRNIRRLWVELIADREADVPSAESSGDEPALEESVSPDDRPTAPTGPGVPTLHS